MALSRHLCKVTAVGSHLESLTAHWQHGSASDFGERVVVKGTFIDFDGDEDWCSNPPKNRRAPLLRRADSCPCLEVQVVPARDALDNLVPPSYLSSHCSSIGRAGNMKSHEEDDADEVQTESTGTPRSNCNSELASSNGDVTSRSRWADIVDSDEDECSLDVPAVQQIVPKTQTPEPSIMAGLMKPRRRNGTFRPQEMLFTEDNHGISTVTWTGDGRKVGSTNAQMVSVAFLLRERGGNMHKAQIRINPRGGASFKKAKGHGEIEVKCDTLPEATSSLTFWFAVSSGREGSGVFQGPRGPVTKCLSDMKNSITFGLPKDSEYWDVASSVDKSSNTFAVCLAVLEPWSVAQQ